MKKIIYLLYLFLISRVAYAQTPTNKMINFLFEKDGWHYADSLYKNEEKAEINTQKIKSRKIFYHQITSSLADAEYLWEISEYDSLGNQLKKTKFFDDGNLSSTEIKTYDKKNNLTQITTRNYCGQIAIALNDCHMSLYYEECFYYDNNNKTIKYQLFYPNKDSVFNKDKSTPQTTEIYQYNALAKPFESIELSGNDTVSHFQYYYNKNQQLIKQINCSKKTETLFTYNDKGQPMELKIGPDNFKIQCQYDKKNNLTKITKITGKGELFEEYSYSYIYDTYTPQLTTYEKHFNPESHKEYSSETRYSYNKENKLLQELEKNDRGNVVNQIICKYNKSGLLIEQYENLISGSEIRFLRYEYEFYK